MQNENAPSASEDSADDAPPIPRKPAATRFHSFSDLLKKEFLLHRALQCHRRRKGVRCLILMHKNRFLRLDFLARVSLPILRGPAQAATDRRNIHMCLPNNFKTSGHLNFRGYTARVMVECFVKHANPLETEKNIFAFGGSKNYQRSALLRHQESKDHCIIILVEIQSNIYTYITIWDEKHYFCPAAHTPNFYFRGYKNPLKKIFGVWKPSTFWVGGMKTLYIYRHLQPWP